MGFFKKNFGKKNNEEYYEEIPGRYEDEEYDDFDDYDDDGYYDDPYDNQGGRAERTAAAPRSYERERTPAYTSEPSIGSRRGQAQQRSNVVTMNDYSQARGTTSFVSGNMKMVIFKPSSYDETESVIDSLKANKPIVINLDEINPQVAQRILDFISGAVYAVNGDIRRAARNIFVVAPSNIEISSTGLDDDSVHGEL